MRDSIIKPLQLPDANSTNFKSKFNAGFSRGFSKQYVGRRFEDTSLDAATATKERQEKNMQKKEAVLQRQKEKLDLEIKKVEEAKRKIQRLQEREAKRIETQYNTASIIIQSICRMYICQRRMRKRIALNKIIQLWTMYCDRCKYIKLRNVHRRDERERLLHQSSQKISYWFFSRLCKKREIERRITACHVASVKIQSLWRGLVARQECTNMKINIFLIKLHHKAAINIQRYYRGFMVRQILSDLSTLVVNIQACFRGYKVRKQSNIQACLNKKELLNKENCLNVKKSSRPFSLSIKKYPRKEYEFDKNDQFSIPKRKQNYWLPSGNNKTTRRVLSNMKNQSSKDFGSVSALPKITTPTKYMGKIEGAKFQPIEARHHTGNSPKLNPLTRQKQSVSIDTIDTLYEQQLEKERREKKLKEVNALKEKNRLFREQLHQKQQLQLLIQKQKNMEERERFQMEKEERLIRLVVKQKARRRAATANKKKLEQECEAIERIKMEKEDRSMHLFIKLKKKARIWQKKAKKKALLEVEPQVNENENEENSPQEQVGDRKIENNSKLFSKRSNKRKSIENALLLSMLKPLEIDKLSSTNLRKPSVPSQKPAKKSNKIKSRRQSKALKMRKQKLRTNLKVEAPFLSNNSMEESEVTDQDIKCEAINYAEEFEDFVDERMLEDLICKDKNNVIQLY